MLKNKIKKVFLGGTIGLTVLWLVGCQVAPSDQSSTSGSLADISSLGGINGIVQVIQEIDENVANSETIDGSACMGQIEELEHTLQALQESNEVSDEEVVVISESITSPERAVFYKVFWQGYDAMLGDNNAYMQEGLAEDNEYTVAAISFNEKSEFSTLDNGIRTQYSYNYLLDDTTDVVGSGFETTEAYIENGEELYDYGYTYNESYTEEEMNAKYDEQKHIQYILQGYEYVLSNSSNFELSSENGKDTYSFDMHEVYEDGIVNDCHYDLVFDSETGAIGSITYTSENSTQQVNLTSLTDEEYSARFTQIKEKVDDLIEKTNQRSKETENE